jgi:hypothetical protein
MKDSDFSKVIGWIMRSFFIGLGILLGYSILEAIFDKFDSLENILLRILFLTVIGGLVSLIYKEFSK